MSSLKKADLMSIAAAGSAALLVSAFAFQYIGGLAPCALCLWQRWPHVVAVVAGLVGMAVPATLLALSGAGAMLVNSGIAAYHTGVERKWWPGPSTCSGGGEDLGAMSGADLLSMDAGPAIVMCDEIPWTLFGLSMANYNLAAGLVLAGLWVWAARRPA